MHKLPSHEYWASCVPRDKHPWNLCSHQHRKCPLWPFPPVQGTVLFLLLKATSTPSQAKRRFLSAHMERTQRAVQLLMWPLQVWALKGFSKSFTYCFMAPAKGQRGSLVYRCAQHLQAAWAAVSPTFKCVLGTQLVEMPSISGLVTTKSGESSLFLGREWGNMKRPWPRMHELRWWPSCNRSGAFLRPE